MREQEARVGGRERKRKRETGRKGEKREGERDRETDPAVGIPGETREKRGQDGGESIFS